jgi:hypothetical protein
MAKHLRRSFAVTPAAFNDVTAVADEEVCQADESHQVPAAASRADEPFLSVGIVRAQEHGIGIEIDALSDLQPYD